MKRFWQNTIGSGILAIAALTWLPRAGQCELVIVTTTTDLAQLATEIGRDRIEILSLAKGYQDPHFVDAKPSSILKLQRADMFIQVGLDLETGWVPQLLEAARNRDIFYGGKGYVNASEGIALLEVPQGDPALLRAQGDIHAWGNPHYWLNPMNGKRVAETITRRMMALAPADAAFFERNYHVLAAAMDSAAAVWKQRLAPYSTARIVAYHNSWPYFSDYFGIEIAGFIEPKPGIPPTPSHLISIIKLMERENIKTIIISPYFDEKPAVSVAKRVDAKVIAFASSVGALPSVRSYFDLFDHNTQALVNAFQEKGISPMAGLK